MDELGELLLKKQRKDFFDYLDFRISDSDNKKELESMKKKLEEYL